MSVYELSASDAIERLARKLGLPIDLDDPQPALIAAVERAVEMLILQASQNCGNATRECATPRSQHQNQDQRPVTKSGAPHLKGSL